MARLVRRLGPALLVLSLLLSGCTLFPKAHDRQFVAMDTFMHLTAYGNEAQNALARAQEEIVRMETLLNVNNEKSEVSAVNHRASPSCTLSPELTSLLEQALILARQTHGAFDPTVYPVVRAWGFTTGTYRLPEPEELSALSPLVGHEKAHLDGHTLTLEPGMMLDFGGIAKGWAGDLTTQLLRGKGITSAILRLGGNIHTIGTKPDGSLWTVGIEDPATGGTLGTLSVADLAVVTSGSYQRFFTVEGQDYHQIIDPATGRPADSGLTSVTIIGPSGTRCDVLSTALFVMGLDKGIQFWREHRDFEAIFVSQDGSVAITAGLEGNFKLSASLDGPVEVLK